MERINFNPRDIIAKRYMSPLDRTELRFRHGHIAITNYKLGDNWPFEKYISVWQDWKYRMIGGFYYRETRELRLPRGYSLETLKSFFPPGQYNYVIDNDHNPTNRADIQLYYPPNKDIQKIVLAHVLGMTPYENMKKYTQHAVNLDTGDGKTYVATAIMAALNKRAVIFVPTKHIADQWISSITKFTSITKKQICFINSSKVAYEVAHGEYSECMAYVIMQGSFDAYIKTYGSYMGERMIASTGAHIKIVDEVHMNIKKVMAIEALCNCKLNIYLSATFERADRIETAIFNKCFKETPKIGASLKHKEEAHIRMAVGEYKWRPTEKALRAMVSQKGLSPVMYEKELMREAPNVMTGCLAQMMKFFDKICKPDSRILIMTTSIEGIEFLANFVKKQYPDKKVGIYHSGLSKSERAENIQADIIIATTKGLGVGTDIPKLQFIHNFATYSNQKDSKQFSGRGRNIGDRDVWYCEYVNIGYYKTSKQFEYREPALIKKAYKGIINRVNLTGSY